MLKILAAQQLIASGLAHVFAQTPGAHDALSRHAGKALALDLVLFRVNLRIAADGTLHADSSATPDAVIFVGPDLVAQLPFKGKAAFREARTEGDAELLSAFNDAFQQLDVDAEAELSRLFGPVAGFRLAEAGRAFSQWLSQAATGTARTLAEYAVEESPMLASPVDVARFNREVDVLRDDASRLEARLALLEKRS
jgi:ubiquinone biosynthesis accessory factor UbiJ